MSKWLCLAVVLTFAASASASVQVFFTNAGTNPWLGAGPTGGPFDPTGDRQDDYGLDGYVPDFSQFPTSFVPSATGGLGDTVYMWVRFNHEPNWRLRGLDLVLGGVPAEAAYYVCDNTGDPAIGNKRWEGTYTPPNDPEFKGNPRQVLVAVTTPGIRNTPGDLPWNLYKGGIAHTALLGAVRYDQPGVYMPDLGPLGILFGELAWVEFGSLTVTPEPAAWVLIVLAGLVVRRR